MRTRDGKRPPRSVAPVGTSAVRCGLRAWNRSPSSAASREAEAGALRRLLSLVLLWSERARQRDRLARLPDRALADIGLSRCDAYRETRKPFWRA
jgi:uncharacterized protein YjiS (DUF1127 family)